MEEARENEVPTVQSPAAGCLLSFGRLVVALGAAYAGARIVGFGTAWLSETLAGILSAAMGFVILVVLLFYLRRVAPGTWRNQPSVHVSHWSTMIERLSLRPSDFYESLAEAIGSREIPDLSVRRIYAREGGVGSARRLYLEVRRGRLVFHLCGAPFANGFFISWWLGEVRSILVTALSLLPLSGVMFPWLFRGRTHYEIDTTLMFQSLVHSAVLEVVDGLSADKGIRGPTDVERKPILRDLFSQ